MQTAVVPPHGIGKITERGIELAPHGIV